MADEVDFAGASIALYLADEGRDLNGRLVDVFRSTKRGGAWVIGVGDREGAVAVVLEVLVEAEHMLVPVRAEAVEQDDRVGMGITAAEVILNVILRERRRAAEHRKEGEM